MSTSRRRRSRNSKAAADRPESRGFLPKVLDRTVIAIPLLDWFKDPKKKGKPFDVVVDLNLNYREGLVGARKVVEEAIDDIIKKRKTKKKTTRMIRPVVDQD